MTKHFGTEFETKTTTDYHKIRMVLLPTPAMIDAVAFTPHKMGGEIMLKIEVKKHLNMFKENIFQLDFMKGGITVCSGKDERVLINEA